MSNFLKRAFHLIGGEAAKLWFVKMPNPPEIGLGCEFSKRIVQRRLESPGHIRPRLLNIPSELNFEISDEKRSSLDSEAHCCCFCPRTRLPIAFISSSEYGANGPSIAFRSSASN